MNLDCPECKKSLYFNSRRWNHKTICPNCKSFLLIDFDFIVMEDYEEWDIYDLQKISEDKYYNFYKFTKEIESIIED